MKKNIKETAEFVEILAKQLTEMSKEHPGLFVDMDIDLTNTGIVEVPRSDERKWREYEDAGGRIYDLKIEIPNYK